MATLFGKADPSLVAAAFKEGQSRVPLDLSGVYKQREQNIADFTKGVQDIFKALDAEDKEWRDKNKANFDIANDSWILSPEMNTHMLGINDAVVRGFKERQKEDLSDLEKAELEAEINKYANLSQKNDEILGSIIQLGANNSILATPGSDEQKLIGLIVEDYNNNTSVTKAAYDKGDIVFSLPDSDVKMTLSELSRKLGKKDDTPNISVQNLIMKNGKSSKRPWDDDYERDFKTKLDKILVNNNDILNVSQEIFQGMDFSVEDLLTGRLKDGYKNPVMQDIYDILDTITLPDIDNDDDYDADDIAIYSTPENGAELAKAIMNNESAYREVISSLITNHTGEQAHKIGRYDFEGNGNGNGNGDDDTITLNPSGNTQLFKKHDWVSNSVINSLVENINNREPIPLAKGEGTMEWSDDDEAYVYTPEGGTTVIVEDKDELFRKYFKSHDNVSTQVVGQEWWTNIDNWSAGEKRQEDTFSPITNMTVEDFGDDDNKIARTIQGMMPGQFTKANPANLYFDVKRGTERDGGTGPLSARGQWWQEDITFEGVALYGEDDRIMVYPKVYPKGAIIKGEDVSGKPHPNAGKEVKIETGGSISERKKNLKKMENILITFGLADKIKPKP